MPKTKETKNVNAGCCRVYHKNGKLSPTKTACNIYKHFVLGGGYSKAEYYWLCECEGIHLGTANVQYNGCKKKYSIGDAR